MYDYCLKQKDGATRLTQQSGMELTDIRLRSIVQFDPIKKSFEQSQNLKYFRQPNDLEYPLDLNRGYDEFTHRCGVFPDPFDQVQHYLMHVDQTKQVLQQTDFILHRHTLRIFIDASPVVPRAYRFQAFRFKGCIFIKLLDDMDNEAVLRHSYAFKARQYLLTERLGEDPDTDTPIDQRMQQYGMFSAKIGQFRLLYTGEVTGLSNTEPLGDLTDQQELDKCRQTNIRVVREQISWRSTFRYDVWVRQAYLSGVHQLVVASFDDHGQVVRPIEVESMETLLKSDRLNIGNRVQRIHQFLEMISQKLEDLDNPAVSVRFQLIGENLVFEEALDTEFIDYVNQL
ncbi:decapping and exoribonuclease protein Rai1-like isoform X2 [Drosophila kikkawai]|uniref:Decapping nuclease n=1 Tax=Drosophila kikkawai TaxID=30033 RepID=A0ABM4GP46_DROKI